MNKLLIPVLSAAIIVCFSIGSMSATKEAPAVKKPKKTVKKVIKIKTKTITAEQNGVLMNKKLQEIKKGTTIILTPTCECAPPPDPADVHPSTQF